MVYLPAGYQALGKSYPRLILFEGQSYEVNRRFRVALKAKGYEVEFDGAHEYNNWQDTLADGLTARSGKT